MIKEAGVKAVARLLASPKSSLRSINVSWNSFKVGGVSLALALRGNNVLQDLELEGCNAGNALGDALAHALSNPDSALRTLNLQNTKLGPEGLAKFAAALAANMRLQRLSLQHPSLGDEGAEILGACLARNTVLTDLTLQASGVGPKGAIALADGLASSAVVSLRLSGNRLCCSNDAGTMGERLGRLPGIAQLDLQGAACASRGSPYASEPRIPPPQHHADMHACMYRTTPFPPPTPSSITYPLTIHAPTYPLTTHAPTYPLTTHAPTYPLITHVPTRPPSILSMHACIYGAVVGAC